MRKIFYITLLLWFVIILGACGSSKILKHPYWVGEVVYSPVGDLIASRNTHKKFSIRLWDAGSGKAVHVFEDTGADSLAFSPDGSRLILGGIEDWNEPYRTGAVQVWDIRSFELLRTLPTYLNGMVTHVMVSPDGSLLVATVDAYDFVGGLWVWDFQNWELLYHDELDDSIDTLAFTKDGDSLFLISDSTVWSFNKEDEEISSWKFRNKKTWVGISISHDLSMLAIGENKNPGGQITLYDLRNGGALGTLPGHAESTIELVYSPDDSILASHGNEGNDTYTIKLWDVTNGELLKEYNDLPCFAGMISFSPDGKFLVATFGGDFCSTGKVVIKVWDTSSWQEVDTLLGHKSTILSISFSPDGSFLASGSKDYTVRLWDFSQYTP